MFKIMNKMDKCDRYNRFKIILEVTVTRQPYKENFFYNRIVNIWNQLLSEILEATSVNSFKAGQISCHSMPDNTLTDLASIA
jgi:hypothetical protein